jgi:hypothetical protein
MNSVTAALGWLGMAGTMSAYVLLSRGRLASESLVYTLLNTVGGVLGGIASILYGAWPSVASNFLWAAIGLVSAVQLAPHRRRGVVGLVAVTTDTDPEPAADGPAMTFTRPAASLPQSA